tara:strand:- start:4090 stop:4500 length:411 start_codon:yes stop_codon:yes gene_type:complete
MDMVSYNSSGTYVFCKYNYVSNLYPTSGKVIMKFGAHHYRPLIKGLTISNSNIDGLGLHATMDWNAGTFLGESHVWSEIRHDWIRTPLGGFINHSDHPNCFILTHDNKRELYTVVPVKQGDEITVFYTQGYDDIIM